MFEVERPLGKPAYGEECDSNHHKPTHSAETPRRHTPVNEQYERSSFVVSPPGWQIFAGSVKPRLLSRPCTRMMYKDLRRMMKGGSSPGKEQPSVSVKREACLERVLATHHRVNTSASRALGGWS